MFKPTIAPSILSADFADFRTEVSSVAKAGCQLLHVDVMDGHFVPNITFGPATVKALRKVTEIPFDIHLMVSDPEVLLDQFAEAEGKEPGSIITVHQEACPHIHRTLEKIHRLGMKAGVAINPGTAVSVLKPVIKDVDMVLIMTVDPGFGGQALIGSCLDKIGEIRELAKEAGCQVMIELDGGVKMENMELVKEADVLVMGSAVFKNGDPKLCAENFAAAQKQFEKMKK